MTDEGYKAWSCCYCTDEHMTGCIDDHSVNVRHSLGKIVVFHPYNVYFITLTCTPIFFTANMRRTAHNYTEYPIHPLITTSSIVLTGSNHMLTRFLQNENRSMLRPLTASNTISANYNHMTHHTQEHSHHHHHHNHKHHNRSHDNTHSQSNLRPVSASATNSRIYTAQSQHKSPHYNSTHNNTHYNTQSTAEQYTHGNKSRLHTSQLRPSSASPHHSSGFHLAPPWQPTNNSIIHNEPSFFTSPGMKSVADVEPNDVSQYMHHSNTGNVGKFF